MSNLVSGCTARRAPASMLADAVETRRFCMALCDFLAQSGGLEHLDPRPHAHYPVRQLRRALDGHRQDRRAVAARHETLAAMNRARTHVRLGLCAVNLQLDFSLRAVDDSESSFGVRLRIEPGWIDEALESAVGLTNEFDRSDSLHRQINSRFVSIAMAEQVEPATIGDQRVGIEIVMMALPGQPRVVDLEPALVQQRAQDYVELLAEVGVVLRRIRHGVKLALEIGQPRLLRQAQVLKHLLPQPFYAFLQHRAFQELEHGEREIQQRDLI